MKKAQLTDNKFAATRHKISKIKSLSFRIRSSLFFFGFLCVSLVAFAACQKFSGSVLDASKDSVERISSDCEKAIYTKQEFFGQEAFVPMPTREVRENLNSLITSHPDDLQILEKLADANEKLEKFDEAEANLKHLMEIDGTKNELLIQFYDRRGDYKKEAATLEKSFDDAPPKARLALFERLLNLAQLHDLHEYLSRDFYTRVAQENTNVYPVFKKLINNFFEEKDYQSAIEFVRLAKTQFPAARDELLDKEIEILLVANRRDEAEKVYQAAFDPFWSNEEAQKFYDFLSDRDHLRVYGGEVKARFKKNPADFDAGIRLALYQNYDHSYGDDEITPIILKLETAKKDWTTDELVTVTRLLLMKNECATASRFLYTLFVRREDFKSNPELRAKVLYQLFEMFSDAENEKLPISSDDLRYYEDVAHSDTDPGIATGILSLIFSDSNPRQKFSEQEEIANKNFNRAAAYRIFEEYKKESDASLPSPELAQMYLDLVKLYVATGETDFAGKLLDEFAVRFNDSTGYPPVALKLAAAFSAAQNEEKARATYQKVLDYLGKQDVSLTPPESSEKDSGRLSNDYQIASENSFAVSADDAGINIPQPASEKQDIYNYENYNSFHDYLGRQNRSTTYAEVLEKLVSSLAAEKKTAQIFSVYSAELRKHPAEEWLYEQRLEWLEQTNLTEEKLAFYKTALARFPSNNWRDKLARFFIREKRKEEFIEFSENLISSLNDREIEDYLAQFAATNSSANDFNSRLNLKLYQSAHERFPHNINFVNRLLNVYKTNHQDNEWRRLAAAYYFESADVRKLFLDDLAAKNELRSYLQASQNKSGIVYELFRADASARLSNFENAVAAYRHLNEIYPHTAEFSERLISFTRSFGQTNRSVLNEAFAVSKSTADYEASFPDARTRSGEISAEMGNYTAARDEWEKLILQAMGKRQNYIDTAAVYWDYFQYADALRTIEVARTKFSDPTLYAFETGAILEAQHKNTEAIREYVNALDAAVDRDEQKEKAEKRLAKLVFADLKKSDKTPPKDSNLTAQTIEKVFRGEKSKRKNSAPLSLAYAEFLIKIKQSSRAAQVLNVAVSQSNDEEFLTKAKDFYQTNEMITGEQQILRKLVTTSKVSRKKIQYSLQLAQNLMQDKQRDATKNVLSALTKNYPTNYGVVMETSDIYRHLGDDNAAARVLENAMLKARGSYRTAIARKLSNQLIRLDRLNEAEKILSPLYNTDLSNLEIFNQLAAIYVRRQDGAGLRKIFAAALQSLKESGGEKREIDEQIATFRERMINAFTQLKDYRSAVEQYIEIINRDPDNEKVTEQAIRFVKRYGGAETLLNYYQQLAAESFKNYRWNVVLARIYLANNDSENALKNYQAAIVNQPEMPELYLAVAEIEINRNNYDNALKNLDEVLKLSDNAPEYVKKKIEILKKVGRINEIEAEKAKLPDADKKQINTNEFTLARELPVAEREKSLETFRAAFNKLLAEPLSGEFRSSDIAAYVQTLREDESLSVINARLWDLRGKLITIADADNAIDAGEARERLGILDSAIIEAIGAIAKTVATDDELSALHADLEEKITNASKNSEGDQILSLTQNLSCRAGFGDLEEKILLKRIAMAGDALNRQTRLQNLLDFYGERGAYQKNFDLVEQYASDNFSLRAETARLAGNQEKELEALRAIYHQSPANLQSAPATSAAANSEKVQRYLEILSAGNHSELESLTQESSVYQLALINFLISKGERVLAHQAIVNSKFSNAWKVARGAEVSLALKEYDDTAECYFCSALRFTTIGEMIDSAPDKNSFLINADWFRLTREYGEWLSNKSSPGADYYLPAITENQPQNADEQMSLGEFYLRRKQYKKAISHLNLALETENSAVPDERKNVTLSAALYLSGEKAETEKIWSQIFENADETDAIPVALIYFQTLQKFGLAEEARKPLPPAIIKFLEQSDADQSADIQKLIRLVAASFTDEREKAKYFEQILARRPTDKSLAAMLINENLIAPENSDSFYARLIEKNSFDNSSYDFAAVRRRVWSRDDAENIYDQENDYGDSDQTNDYAYGNNGAENADGTIKKWDGETWRKKYLQMLTIRGENFRAEQFVAKLEKEIGDDAPRPAWLRLEKIRLQIRHGKIDAATVEKFVGIRLPDSATEIKPPSGERLNQILEMLKAENHPDFASRISQAFYARNLALGPFDAENFTGLARVDFEHGEIAEALNILRLFIATNTDEQRESALAEISALEIVKKFAESERDAGKTLADNAPGQTADPAKALSAAADLAAEFGQNNAAMNFRQQLVNISPNNVVNKIALAKLLFKNSASKSEAIRMLNEISDDRNSSRENRWQARMMLSEQEEFSFSGTANYDAFAQFYQGKTAAQINQNEQAVEYFLSSLIDDKDAGTDARQELIKAYVSIRRYYAAIKLAETDKSAKSDDLLRILEQAAEEIGEFQKAIEYEKSRSDSGDKEKISRLEKLAADKNKRVSDLIVDAENTRKV